MSQTFFGDNGGHIGVHFWKTDIPEPAVIVMVADDGWTQNSTNVDVRDSRNSDLIRQAGGRLLLERQRGTIQRIILPLNGASASSPDAK